MANILLITFSIVSSWIKIWKGLSGKWGFHCWYLSIGSGNGLVQNRQQVITGINEYSAHWYIYLYMHHQGPILTHWGRVTHICVNKLTIIGSDNGLSPGRRQAIIWTNVGILFIETLGTNFSEISIEIHTFSFMKMYLKISSAKWHPFCLNLNVLISIKMLSYWYRDSHYEDNMVLQANCLIFIMEIPIPGKVVSYQCWSWVVRSKAFHQSPSVQQSHAYLLYIKCQ